MNSKRFVHEFVDHSVEGSLSFINEPELPARIHLEIDDEGGFWFSRIARAGSISPESPRSFP